MMIRFLKKIVLFSTLLNTLLLQTVAYAGNIHDSQFIELYLPFSKNSTKVKTKLEKLLAEKKLTSVKINTIDHWQKFQQSLRHGKKGIYFAPPHFAAWAIHKYKFKPLVRIAEPISYIITTQRSNTEIFEINDLHSRTICVDQPLNLNYLLINSAFHKLSISPKLVFTKPLEQMRGSKTLQCDAYSVSNHALSSRVQKDDYIRLFQSKDYNNYVLISHPAIPQQFLQKFQRLLVTEQLLELLKPMLSQFSEKPVLVNAQVRDYPIQYKQLLDNYWQ